MYESEFFTLSDRVSKVYGLLSLIVAEPLEEKFVFWKDYFDLDYKHVSHHVEAFKASVNRSIEVSLKSISRRFMVNRKSVTDFFPPVRQASAAC